MPVLSQSDSENEGGSKVMEARIGRKRKEPPTGGAGAKGKHGMESKQAAAEETDKEVIAEEMDVENEQDEQGEDDLEMKNEQEDADGWGLTEITVAALARAKGMPLKQRTTVLKAAASLLTDEDKRVPINEHLTAGTREQIAGWARLMPKGTPEVARIYCLMVVEWKATLRRGSRSSHDLETARKLLTKYFRDTADKDGDFPWKFHEPEIVQGPLVIPGEHLVQPAACDPSRKEKLTTMASAVGREDEWLSLNNLVDKCQNRGKLAFLKGVVSIREWLGQRNGHRKLSKQALEPIVIECLGWFCAEKKTWVWWKVANKCLDNWSEEHEYKWIASHGTMSQKWLSLAATVTEEERGRLLKVPIASRRQVTIEEINMWKDQPDESSVNWPESEGAPRVLAVTPDGSAALIFFKGNDDKEDEEEEEEEVRPDVFTVVTKEEWQHATPPYDSDVANAVRRVADALNCACKNTKNLCKHIKNYREAYRDEGGALIVDNMTTWLLKEVGIGRVRSMDVSTSKYFLTVQTTNSFPPNHERPTPPHHTCAALQVTIEYTPDDSSLTLKMLLDQSDASHAAVAAGSRRLAHLIGPSSSSSETHLGRVIWGACIEPGNAHALRPTVPRATAEKVQEALAKLVLKDEYWAVDKNSSEHIPKVSQRKDFSKWLRSGSFLPVELFKAHADDDDAVTPDELLSHSTFILQQLPRGRRGDLADRCLKFAREHFKDCVMSWVR